MNRLRPYLTLRNGIIAVVLVALVVLGAIFGPMALSAPQVISITPADGAADANPQAPIRVEFNQWVPAGSVAGAVQFDPPVAFTVTEVESPRPWRSVVQIEPREGLQYGAQYRLTLDGSIKNLIGRGLSEPKTVAFTTAPYVTVARLGPDRESQEVALNAPITVEFGAPVVHAETIAAAAEDPTLADTLPQPLVLVPEAQGVGRWLSPTLFGFYPEGGLRSATTYKATLNTDITPDGRARLERPVSWSFKTEAPLLLGTRPYDGATEVPANGAIEVRLAPDVDVASAGAHFSLRLADTGATVQGTIRPAEGGFHFMPTTPLERGQRYQAHIEPGVTTTTGAPLNTDALDWGFSVIGDLEIAQVEPLPDTAEVLTGTNRISVRFNHPVVALTTIDAQAGLPQPLQITPPLAGEGFWLDTSTYVFSPTAGLAPSTLYSMRVNPGLQDQTGGALRQEFSWQFSTITPQVIGSVPFPQEQYAGLDTRLQVIFNQPMDLASLQNTLTLVRDGAAVPGTVRIIGPGRAVVPESNEEEWHAQTGNPVGFVVEFVPAEPLQRGAEYVLAVGAGARAAQPAAGLGTLADGYVALFRVVPLPTLIESLPLDGATNVDPNNSVKLTFSTPMDWESVQRNLTIEPQPTEIFTSTYRAEMYLYFSLQPETDYRITVGAAAHDPYGVTLGQDRTISFSTGSLAPSMALVGAYQAGSYNAYVPTRVPFQHLNVPALHYELYRVEPAEAAVLINNYQAWQDFQANPTGLIKQGDMNLAGERNKSRIDLLNLGQLEADMYYLQVVGGGNSDRQLLAVSPYALTIKRSFDKLFIWAIDLATGQPVSGMSLLGANYSYDRSGLNEPRDLGTTDAEGIIQTQISTDSPYDPLYLWTNAEDRFAFATTNWGEGINPWDFGLTSDYQRNPIAGSVYTDRPIYRPDQTVYIRGAVRLPQEVAPGASQSYYSLPGAGQSAELSIRDPENNSVYSQTLALNEFGTFNASFPLEQSARLGGYTIVVAMPGMNQSPDASPPSFSASFTVAEYRKPTFEITVTPDKADAIQGDTITFDVSARYFSGGALANAPVRWRVLANPLYFAPEDAGNYRFEDLEDAYAWYRWFDNMPTTGGESVSDGQAQTDAQGRFTIKVPADLGKDGHSRTLTLDVEVTDVDGQVIAGQGTTSVHVGAFYIGLRPEGYVAQAGQPQQVSLLTLDPQGAPVGNRALDIGIYKREWYSVREQGADGRFYFTSQYSDTLVTTQQATTDAQGRAGISFTPPEGGSYRIGAEGRDDGGHTVKASAFTWAYGGEVFWGVNDTNRVDLIADKDRYAPGDTAGILVTAPYPGMNALMTIERGEVIEHKLLTFQGTTELLQVPISAEYAPNIYVSVVLVKPAGGDVPVPDLRMGLINLKVSTEQQELAISITADKEQAGPRDQITYTVKATDYTGKGVRAEVGLALVDKAVLSLADDPNPTFMQSFYERRPLGVFTSQTLTALVDRVTLKLQPGDKGGGGGLGAEVLIRRDFPDTAYWNPTLVTGDDGTAQVTLTLPDSLTTWHMTARGLTTDTRVGQVSSDLVATLPLLVRPALPRFLTVGDQPTLQAVLHNNTANPIDATIKLDLSGDGVNGGAAPTLQINAPLEQRTQVPANSTAVVRWPAEVGRQAGQVKLTFTVEGDGKRDAVELALPVQRYMTPEVVASAGQVRDTPVVETLQPPTVQAPAGGTGGSAAPEGEVNLELVPSLAAGIETGLDYLEHYPYLCTEQTVSRFLPNAVTYRLYKQLGIDDPQLKASLETNLTAGLQRLYAMQNLDGGWGWWRDQSNPYLTTYVVQGLVEARRAGYSVDPGVLDKGLDYVQSALGSDLLELGADKWRGNARAFALFVLSEANQPDSGRTIALFEQRTRLDIYGRAYLLMTLKSLGSGQNERVRTLVGEMMSSAIMHTADAHWEEREHDYWTMSSDTRTTGLALQALVRTDPQNFLVPNAVRWLMAQRDQSHWRTTQESAVTLMALAEYIAQSGELEADYTYRAALDGRTLTEGTVNRDNLKDPISVVIALADLKAGGGSQLQLQRQPAGGQTGKGRLYYTLRMRYYQDAAGVQPLDQGLGVQREYIAVDTATLSPTGQLVAEAQQGELVQVRLTLTVPEDVQYLAVEDLLPAGLEPLDTSLRTVSAAAQDPTLEDANAELPYWWYWTQTEIHDNRVALFATNLPRGTYHYTYLARATTAGTYQTLPALAYQMYAPEVFGRSAGVEFVVKGP